VGSWSCSYALPTDNIRPFGERRSIRCHAPQRKLSYQGLINDGTYGNPVSYDSIDPMSEITNDPATWNDWMREAVAREREAMRRYRAGESVEAIEADLPAAIDEDLV
jgi:hypothetical protein